MEDKEFCIKFYHRGDFKNNKYVGGKVFELPKTQDKEVISFTSLMSDVKNELKYEEIGGVYVKTTDKCEFKLLLNNEDVKEYLNQLQNDDSWTLELFIDNVVDQISIAVKKRQPFVVIRPRKLPTEDVSLTKSPRPKVQRRKYVTLKALQQESRLLISKKAKQKELKSNQDHMQVDVSIFDATSKKTSNN